MQHSKIYLIWIFYKKMNNKRRTKYTINWKLIGWTCITLFFLEKGLNDDTLFYRNFTKLKWENETVGGEERVQLGENISIIWRSFSISFCSSKCIIFADRGTFFLVFTVQYIWMMISNCVFMSQVEVVKRGLSHGWLPIGGPPTIRWDTDKKPNKKIRQLYS